MTKHRRNLTRPERDLLTKALQIAAEKFKADANVAPATSIRDAYMRQSIEAERLAAILAEADAIVLEKQS